VRCAAEEVAGGEMASSTRGKESPAEGRARARLQGCLNPPWNDDGGCSSRFRAAGERRSSRSIAKCPAQRNCRSTQRGLAEETRAHVVIDGKLRSAHDVVGDSCRVFGDQGHGSRTSLIRSRSLFQEDLS
jgi:hypothetical protein